MNETTQRQMLKQFGDLLDHAASPKSLVSIPPGLLAQLNALVLSGWQQFYRTFDEPRVKQMYAESDAQEGE